MKKKNFIVGCEELEDGMTIKAKDLDDARAIVNEMIDIHEIDDEGEFID